ncbi:YitT family protein [uncultured Cetobacterium sp.]|uniref:YitT family protein n=1 Tax=uncultured Cetobacterium sp. TaxID=527638 RepID=UPI00262AA847|nr:YitT family protein [uncultured Cetobacterium sp.]
MKRKKLRVLKDYVCIFIGTMIASVGINAFLVPSKLAPGGATGMSILLNYITKIPVGTLIFVINIPLFLIGVKVFGRSYGAKTLAGITFLSLNVELLKWIFPHIDKLIDFSNSGNLILGTLYGGVLMGVGLGIVIKSGGTTGGSDIISGILNKFFKIPIGQGLILVDSTVVLFAAYIFGAEKALFALINLYASGIVINKIINGMGNAKMAYIITSEVEKVRKIIVNDLRKTGNHYIAKALYSKKDRDVITTVLRNREIHLLKELVMEIDKEAFIVVSDVHEVMGRGYTFEQRMLEKDEKGPTDEKN